MGLKFRKKRILISILFNGRRWPCPWHFWMRENLVYKIWMRWWQKCN